MQGAVVECSVLAFQVSRRGLALRVLLSYCGLENVVETRAQEQLVLATARYYTVDYCTVEVSRELRKCGGRRSAAVSSRWRPLRDNCGGGGRRLGRRPLSSFYFRRERFKPAGKRGTLVAGDTPTATALESRVSRLLLVISGSGVWDIVSRRRRR